MAFNGVKLAAIVKLGKLMSAADGHMHKNELAVIALELTQFGVSDSATDVILAASDALEFSDVIPVVKNMTSDEKTHVVSFLGTIIAADGKITESERKICTLVSLLCDLPTITAGDPVRNFFLDDR